MIFAHTWQKVLSGEKTQTRRIVKPEHTAAKVASGTPLEFMSVGQSWGDIVAIRSTNGRDIYATNGTYAVQPGRGKKSIAHIQVTNIQQEDVRSISLEDAHAEGFEEVLQFLEIWVNMHDKTMSFFKPSEHAKLEGLELGTPSDCYRQWLGRKLNWQDQVADQIFSNIMNRPAEHYQAWALTFKLVKE